MDRSNWRAALVFAITLLAILTGNHEAAAADDMPLELEVERLPEGISPQLVPHMMEYDAAKSAPPRIGSVLDNIARLVVPNHGAAKRQFGGELAFMRWLDKQQCIDSDSGSEPLSALVCARQCDALFFGWSDEHVSQLDLVVKSSFLSSEFPIVISVGPDGWSLRHYRARSATSLPCLVNPAPERAALAHAPKPLTRRRVKRLSVLAPDAAAKLTRRLRMRVKRLQLDVRGWPAQAPRRPLGHQRLSDKQLAGIVAALLPSPAVQQLWFTWTPTASYPSVLQAADQALASTDSAVKYLQFVETGNGSRASVERELLPSLLEHTPAGHWSSIQILAIKWASAVALEPQDRSVRFGALPKLFERMPNLRRKHVERTDVPLDAEQVEVLRRQLALSEQARSMYINGTFFGVAPVGLGTAGETPWYEARLMLPWYDANGIPRYNLDPLGSDRDGDLLDTKLLRNTSALTLYAGHPDEVALRATELEGIRLHRLLFGSNQGDDLAIGQASRLERLYVESGQDGVFCHEIVRRLPAVLPASTRHLTLRTFDLAGTTDPDAALTRFEAILAGNPGLVSVTVGLYLPCDNSARAFQHLDRVTTALQSRTTLAAVRIELNTPKVCDQGQVYLKRIRATAPFAAVSFIKRNFDDVATRLHSGSLIYE